MQPVIIEARSVKRLDLLEATPQLGDCYDARTREFLPKLVTLNEDAVAEVATSASSVRVRLLSQNSAMSDSLGAGGSISLRIAVLSVEASGSVDNKSASAGSSINFAITQRFETAQQSVNVLSGCTLVPYLQQRKQQWLTAIASGRFDASAFWSSMDGIYKRCDERPSTLELPAALILWQPLSAMCCWQTRCKVETTLPTHHTRFDALECACTSRSTPVPVSARSMEAGAAMDRNTRHVACDATWTSCHSGLELTSSRRLSRDATRSFMWT